MLLENTKEKIENIAQKQIYQFVKVPDNFIAIYIVTTWLKIKLRLEVNHLSIRTK